MTGQTYPSAQPVGGGADVPGEVFAYGFDAMGRSATMTSGGGDAGLQHVGAVDADRERGLPV